MPEPKHAVVSNMYYLIRKRHIILAVPKEQRAEADEETNENIESETIEIKSRMKNNRKLLTPF